MRNRIARRQIMLDEPSQGGLLKCTVVHWVICLSSVCLFSFCWQLFANPNASAFDQLRSTWRILWPGVVGSFLVLPLALVGALRFSNRLVGPLKQLQRSLRRLANGEAVGRLETRDEDMFAGLTQAFNDVVERGPVVNLGESIHLPDPDQPLAKISE